MSNQIQIQKKEFIKGYEEGMIEGYQEGEKQQKKKDLDEIKKMAKYLYRDDIVKFLEEL